MLTLFLLCFNDFVQLILDNAEILAIAFKKGQLCVPFDGRLEKYLSKEVWQVDMSILLAVAILAHISASFESPTMMLLKIYSTFHSKI